MTPWAKGEAAVLAIPKCNYATSASFGRFGLQAWANWQPLQAHPRTGDPNSVYGYATP
jgi:hypothetical protein